MDVPFVASLVTVRTIARTAAFSCFDPAPYMSRAARRCAYASRPAVVRYQRRPTRQSRQRPVSPIGLGHGPILVAAPIVPCGSGVRFGVGFAARYRLTRSAVAARVASVGWLRMIAIVTALPERSQP